LRVEPTVKLAQAFKVFEEIVAAGLEKRPPKFV
jgi:hypothetical protein